MDMTDRPDGQSPGKTPRIPALDIARTVAICAMVLYHFVFDLDMFGVIPAGTALTGGWRLLALCTAGSFLALAGVSLWLAHGTAIQWRGFWRRFGLVAGAALMITMATRFAIGEGFIFFGILHSIALCSPIGLVALRLPAAVLIALAIFAFWAPGALRADLFNTPALWWVGLSTMPIRAADYVPLFPWIGPFFLGLAFAKIVSWRHAWPTPSGAPSRLQRVLAWPGRHSLAIYLLHQPILIGLLWLAFQLR